MTGSRWAVAATVTLLLAGCGPEEPPVPRVRSSRPAPTMAACPDDSTLTYETFGQSFFGTYCTRCHSSTLIGSAARSGAPGSLNYDTHDGILMVAARIDGAAAAGPTRVNIWMPLSAPTPSDAERDLLGEWLACGAP